MKRKEEVFEEVRKMLHQAGIKISTTDDQRPWGGFFVIDSESESVFIETYFRETFESGSPRGRISPKILIVAPQKKLSWQYHHRRSEIWKLIGGEAAVVRSHTNEEGPPLPLRIGESITLSCGERHRLVGLTDYGWIAEIWKHEDPGHPSDEEDIVRLQDDFGRN